MKNVCIAVKVQDSIIISIKVNFVYEVNAVVLILNVGFEDLYF